MLAVAMGVLAVSAQENSKAPSREFTNSVGMKFVWIRPGSFQMGSDPVTASDEERPVHKVTLTKGYYLQITEVTQAQWEMVMGTNPSAFKGSDRPVENVSWDDAQEFLARLNTKEKDTRYGLPTEAQWEYACRAGGLEPNTAPNLDDVAWWIENSGGKTHPVGQKKANVWGFYDMLGNVSEWCQDWLGAYSPNDQVDPARPEREFPAIIPARVVRGGNIVSVGPSTYQSCSVRGNLRPGYRNGDVGFRCVKTL
jgi:formylglycine-generating enzyme required for sulfatase activity